VIGIVGGYGAVGTHAARLLAEAGAGPLRIGGRDPARARRAAATLPGAAEAAVVDIADDVSLAAFVEDCEVVVDCAGPSYRTGARVARAARAHHVSAGGDTPSDHAGTRCAVFAAGALPGLSGLLPRWLAAREFDDVHGLTCYAGVLGRFTATGAEDYLHDVLGGDHEPLAAWREARPRAAALTRRPAVTLPFFPREVGVVPYLDTEGEHLARALALTEGRWYTVLDGEHLGVALDAARTLPGADAVARLCRAAALDTAGRTPYVILLLQLDGTAAGREITRTAVLRSPGIAELTGAMTAAATLSVLNGEVPAGTWRAAAVLDPSATITRLRPACELTVLDAPIDQLAAVEEGAL
jgi:hypothetical protein